MALIKHEYSKEQLKDLGPPFRQQIGFDIHILRAIKPDIVAKANARIQKRVQPIFAQIKRIRGQAWLRWISDKRIIR
jgi:hypothetical protein